MVINLRVNFEITDNNVYNLVVWAIPAVETLKLPFEENEQLLDISMLEAKTLNDHRSGPLGSPSKGSARH